MSVPRHWLALLRVSALHALRRPVQSGLLVGGVALGVAVGAAIDLANSSALAAFRLSTTAVSGRATHRLVGGPTGLDENLYRRLRVELDLRASAPAVEGVVAVRELGGETLTLLGVDPFAEPPFRDYLAADGSGAGDVLAPLLTVPGAVVLARSTAERAGLAPGRSLTLDGGSREARATLVGLLEPGDALARRAVEGLILADIATAQELLDRAGRLDRIDLLVPDEPGAARRMLARVHAVLPAGVVVIAADEQQATVKAMTDAFRLNLSALALMALVVGMFLVFNTVRFSVLQRRRTLATLRVLGVTRREVFGLVLTEALILGAVGAALGLALGAVLGRLAVGLVTQTINDLFFVANVREVTMAPATIARGMVLGVAAAAAAALLPALEAMSVPPVAAMRRSDVERGARAAAPRALALGLVVAAGGGAVLLVPGQRVDLGFAGLAGVLLAFALAAPAVTLVVMALAGPVAGRLLGVVGRMAPRDVTRALSRTAVAIAALAVAVSVSIGVQVMVDSFRASVEDWLAGTLRADVFVSARSVGPTVARGALDPRALRHLAALPQVARATTALDAAVRSPDAGAVDLVVVGDDLAGERRRYVDALGPPAAVWRAVTDGAVIVSEPFARRLALGAGDELVLVTDAGPRGFRVAGVFRDYASSHGVVLMADAVYRSHWQDDRLTSVALDLVPGADPDALVTRLRRELAPFGAVEVRSTRGLREAVLGVFDRAFAITGALRLLAVVVAFMGVLSALLSLQLERAREHATLRATGLTRRQLGGLTLLESGLVGATAGLLSWPAGLSLALVLIHVINRRSFGWTVDAHVGSGPFVLALALAVAAALLAGAFPAWRLGRLPIAQALREE